MAEAYIVEAVRTPVGRRGGGPSGGARGRQARKGADVEYPVSLTFEQAARGTTMNLQIDRGGQIETIEVKIPAGVKDGSRVRIARLVMGKLLAGWRGKVAVAEVAAAVQRELVAMGGLQ